MTTKTSARTKVLTPPTVAASGRSNGSDPASAETKPIEQPGGRSTNGTQPTTEQSRPKLPASAASDLSLHDLIREVDTDPSLSHRDVALLVRALLEAEGATGWEIVQPAIDAYVNTARRSPVRCAEQALLRTFTPGDGTQPAASPVTRLSLDQLRAFADERINLGRGERVRAGEISVEQWNAKIAALVVGIAARQETVRRYQSVRDTLVSIGFESIDAALRGDRRGRSR